MCLVSLPIFPPSLAARRGARVGCHESPSGTDLQAQAGGKVWSIASNRVVPSGTLLDFGGHGTDLPFVVQNFRDTAFIDVGHLPEDDALARTVKYSRMINSILSLCQEHTPAERSVGHDLALRSRIRQWQPQLRTLFVTRIALLKYRLQLPGFELPESVRVAQQAFDDQLAKTLEGMANRIDGEAPGETDNFNDSFERLEQTIQNCRSEAPQKLLPVELQTFLALSRSVESVTMSLNIEI